MAMAKNVTLWMDVPVAQRVTVDDLKKIWGYLDGDLNLRNYRRYIKMWRLKEALVRKPDLDNLCMAAIDGIKGIILKDDTVVTRLSAEKRFGPEPMTVITIKEWGNDTANLPG